MIDPRKSHLTFGDEKVNYLSATKEAYVYDSVNSRPSVLADEVKKGRLPIRLLPSCRALLMH